MFLLKRRPTYAGAEGDTTSITQALQFSSVEHAERYKQRVLDSPYDYLVVDEFTACAESAREHRRIARDSG